MRARPETPANRDGVGHGRRVRELSGDSQSRVHGLESFFGLLEKAEDERVTELMITRVVHLEDLVEGVYVHGLTQQEFDIIVADGLRYPESV